MLSMLSRIACWKMIALMVTMVYMLVVFARFANRVSIIYGVIVLDAFAKIANKFLSTDASMKGLVLTNLVR